MSDLALKRKLVLNRETLVPLQHDELQQVNGGTGWVCSAVRLSYQGIKVLASLYGSYQATRASYEATRQVTK